MEQNTSTIPDYARLAARLINLREIEGRVAKIAAGEIIFSPALLTRYGVPIIRRGTINMIQGKSGSFKSKLAELVCSLLLCPEGKSIDFSLGFERVEDQQLKIVYVDTERNQTEEFPAAIKSIMNKIGLSDPSEAPNFRFTSLKNVNRSNRLSALKVFIEDIKKGTTDPLFVLLDVVTDCIANFNDPAESMELFDYIGGMCEDLDATFLLVIHENPGSEKSRGHTGTEATNKSSTVLSIGFQKGTNGENTELLQLKFIKQRHAKQLESIPLIFSQETLSLQPADPALVKSITDQRRSKASVSDIAATLGAYLKPSLEQKELLAALNSDFYCSANTIKTRLEEVERNGIVIQDHQGISCHLKIKSRNGRPTVYELLPEQVVDFIE
jgi:hypothetical protein